MGLVQAALYSLLGISVVFATLALLMVIVQIFYRLTAPKEAPRDAEPASASALKEAPGTAGNLKLYDTDPRDAAMVMAIVADTLGKPLNELRFISIRELKEEEQK